VAKVLRYADWTAAIAKNGPATAYLFVGPESLLRDQAILELRDALTADGTPPPIERFQGGETPLAQVMTAFSIVGFFAPRRLVVVSSIEKYGRVSAGERDELIRTVRDADPGSSLVMVSELPLWEFQRKNAFCEALSSSLTTVEFAHPRPAEALRWIQGECARRKILLDPAAGELLVEKIGTSLQELARELEKLSLWGEPGERITEERLRELMRQGFLGNLPDLMDAVLRGSSESIRQWIGLGGTEPVLRVVWLLQQRAREQLARGGTGAERLEAVIHGAYALEKGIKSGQLPGSAEETALECLLVSAQTTPRKTDARATGRGPETQRSASRKR
jgi:DNA polymerase III delta subunit